MLLYAWKSLPEVWSWMHRGGRHWKGIIPGNGWCLQSYYMTLSKQNLRWHWILTGSDLNFNIPSVPPQIRRKIVRDRRANDRKSAAAKSAWDVKGKSIRSKRNCLLSLPVGTAGPFPLFVNSSLVLIGALLTLVLLCHGGWSIESWLSTLSQARR